MEKSARIYVAGYNGMGGSAVVRRVSEEEYTRLILRTRPERDLTDQKIVQAFPQGKTAEYVFICAAKVGRGPSQAVIWA